MPSVISVNDVGKQYQVRHEKTRGGYRTLRDTIADVAGRALRRGAEPDNSVEEFWALREVTFDVGPGEVVGIIGRNGSGKSTLLKILSRITRPTEGRIEIRGRVSSLLEVGTGFHPELTGRENIFLNGAILGMGSREVLRKFDEIVAFAETERFLDTPVKRYSSGMYVRLAFAVAAHLDPEILIIDEVLAVGDAEFQKKCLGRMSAVAKGGRTVLFVSHNLSAVQQLCTRGVVLKNGQMVCDLTAADAVEAYLALITSRSGQCLRERTDRTGTGVARLEHVEIQGGGGTNGGTLRTGEPAEFAFAVSRSLPELNCVFTIYDARGAAVANFNSRLRGLDDETSPAAKFTCHIDELLLLPGHYRINAALAHRTDTVDHVEGAAVFEVHPGPIRSRPTLANNLTGSVCVPHTWTLPGA